MNETDGEKKTTTDPDTGVGQGLGTRGQIKVQSQRGAVQRTEGHGGREVETGKIGEGGMWLLWIQCAVRMP